MGFSRKNPTVGLRTHILYDKMCGILILHLRKEQKDLDRICEGYTMLSNRGPDQGSLTIKSNDDLGGSLILGFRRLAIVDTSTLGMQPFSYGGAQMVCNGEIYNHHHLKNIYNIKCVSQSDCECILPLFFKLGFENLVQVLNGDFAFAISYNKKIYYARDRMGVRPLFHGITSNGNFALASYARALTSYCSTVNAIPPGWGIYDSISFTMVNQYFPLTLGPILITNAEKNVRETLTLSIKDRLMTDRPMGCLLSGGLDSSLITSIICKLVGPSNVRTYSIGMEGSIDLKYAKTVAEYLGTHHTEILFTPQEGFDAIPDVIRDLESYDITTIRASVAMWLGAKYIAKHTDDIVLFSGEGADELFCGYLYFHHAPSMEALQNESIRLLKELYLYDVLRADRCISSHGLELRVPFLDRRLIDICLSLEGKDKAPKGGLEKDLLRRAFQDDYIPLEVLLRRKDGMSDGVSGSGGKKWCDQISDFVHAQISQEEFEPYEEDYPSIEAYYYKKIYDKIFPTYQPIYNYWMPRWIDHNGDPSGRNLEIFNT